MTRVGVMSDSHGIVSRQMYEFFKDVDIILHCGDIGSWQVLEKIRKFKPTVAVYGNIDGAEIYQEIKKVECFKIEDCKILMTHIGGYPEHYEKAMREMIAREKPNIFLSGHSHILRVMYDKKYMLLHINPGACGKSGFHTKSTMVRFVIDKRTPKDLEIMEMDRSSVSEA